MCPAGSYSNTGLNTPCGLCPVGTYQSQRNMKTCTQCPHATTTVRPGSVTTDDCQGIIILHKNQFTQLYVEDVMQLSQKSPFSYRVFLNTVFIHQSVLHSFSFTSFEGIQLNHSKYIKYVNQLKLLKQLIYLILSVRPEYQKCKLRNVLFMMMFLIAFQVDVFDSDSALTLSSLVSADTASWSVTLMLKADNNTNNILSLTSSDTLFQLKNPSALTYYFKR